MKRIAVVVGIVVCLTFSGCGSKSPTTSSTSTTTTTFLGRDLRFNKSSLAIRMPQNWRSFDLSNKNDQAAMTQLVATAPSDELRGQFKAATEAQKQGLLLFAYEYNPKPTFSAELKVVRQTQPDAERLTAQTLRDQLLPIFAANKGEIESIESASLHGHPAFRVLATNRAKKTSVERHQIQYYVPQGNTLYVLSGTSVDNQRDPELSSIMETFSW